MFWQRQVLWNMLINTTQTSRSILGISAGLQRLASQGLSLSSAFPPRSRALYPTWQHGLQTKLPPCTSSVYNTDLHSSTQIWFTPNLHSWVRSEPEYPLVSLASSRSLSRGGGLVTSVLKQLSKICNRSSSSGRSTRIFLWKRLKIAGSRPQGRLVEARKRMLPSPSLSKPSSWTSSSALHRLLAYRNLHRCQDHYKRL